MRKWFVLAMAGLLLGGCGLFGGGNKPYRNASFAADYAGLEDKSVAIVLLVPTATVNEYPGARDEISNFIATEMRGHLGRTRLLAARDVLNWQSDTLNWYSLSEKEIGEKFGVDRVLFVHVLDYSTRKVLSPSSLQGHLKALCRIVEVDSNAPPNEPAWTGLMDVAWPPDRELDPIETNETAVRMRTLESFSAQLVRYFYPREAVP